MDQVLQVLLEGPPRMTSLQEKEAKWEITLEVGATAVIHLQDHKTKTRMDPEGEADLVLLLMKTMMISMAEVARSLDLEESAVVMKMMIVLELVGQDDLVMEKVERSLCLENLVMVVTTTVTESLTQAVMMKMVMEVTRAVSEHPFLERAEM